MEYTKGQKILSKILGTILLWRNIRINQENKVVLAFLPGAAEV